MNPIEEIFNTKDVLGWLKKRLEFNRNRKRDRGLKISEEDFRRIPYGDLIKLYGMVAGCNDQEARYNLDAFIMLCQHLVKHGFTMSIGPKRGGYCLGDIFFSDFKAVKKKIYGEGGIPVELPRRRIPSLRVSNQLKKIASIAYCPYCEGKKNVVPLRDYKTHLEVVHGISSSVEDDDYDF